ncbi:DsbE family thiol:disulfide interchange protein [Granulosicoccaceae sp. 1_MG-2023]|nr:DsbE family thiol:disulfide interchange protein [Granulosicoccaceae sp. 1_MG-2023]
MMKYFLPLGGFILLCALLFFGLGNDPKKVPSPFIGKPAPAFELPRLYADGETLSPADMQGKVWLLNVWASWCVSCRAEHAVITKLIGDTGIDIVGLNYKDTDDEAKRWLTQFGNPYYAIAVDAEGRTGIDWGVYGVPETFVIDKKGTIRLKHIGPVTVDDLKTELIPLIETLRGESA